MAVSKRLRFEILRRDNNACRYCGATAPEVKLTVDHVIPTALGGSDEPANLVACCAGCNSGKSSSSPDAPTVADVAADALRWGAAIQRAATGMLADLEHRQRRHSQFLEAWNSWTFGDGPVDLPNDWRATVDQFAGAGLPMLVLLECVELAMGSRTVKISNLFRYMCGIAWSRVSELQESARQDVNPDEDEKPSAYPMLDVLDECFIRQAVEAAGGDKVMSKLAMQCMWEVAAAGARGWKRGIEEGLDYSDSFDAAKEEAEMTAAYFLNAIAERSRGEL